MLCACGCGTALTVKGYFIPKYVKGHYNRNRRVSVETRRKISISQVGVKWSLGRRKRFGELIKGTSKPPLTSKRKKQISELWKDPKYRKRVGEAIRNSKRLLSKDPIWKEKQFARASRVFKKKWKDPIYRAKQLKGLERARASVRSVDTRPERIVRCLLDSLNFKYEHPYRVLGNSVDFYIPYLNLIIEVDGCWWHACERCNRGFLNRYPEEIKGFVERQYRDAFKENRWRDAGYNVLRVIEHDIDLLDFEDALRGKIIEFQGNGND